MSDPVQHHEDIEPEHAAAPLVAGAFEATPRDDYPNYPGPARMVYVNRAVSGRITTSTDNDYFLVSAGQRGTYTVKVTASPSSVGCDLYNVAGGMTSHVAGRSGKSFTVSWYSHGSLGGTSQYMGIRVGAVFGRTSAYSFTVTYRA